ncbi:hypothetical protein GH714_011010 [Hevea brasiliensis]|uniref:Uncharacterized protein n=1 Tax=Hevea brasiliensis TaxID=3981 RepID=A0A6A6LKV2_HEVBR|nr:hypothetical protein GH714_011010 [Hevea brasiliensis]
MQDSESEYDSSDELYTESDFEGEGGIRYPQFNHDKDIRDPTFKLAWFFLIKKSLNQHARHMESSIDLEMYNSIQWAFMSDRQKGRFKGKELKDLVWNAARATYTAKLNYWLDKIKQKNSKAREWLRERPCEN